MKRTRPATSLFLTVSALFVVLQGCNTSTELQQPQNTPDEPTGGTPAVVPGSGTGGATSATTTAGATGGNGTATTTATGGMQGSPQGGAATGGSKPAATGGKPATGGSPGVTTGGTPGVATGGAPIGTATGGSPIVTATGGAAVVGAGGTTTTTTVVNSGNKVTFNASGKASGAMSGWAFVAMGTADTVSVPTCGTTNAAITSAASCKTTTNWPATGICVTGSAVPQNATYTNWGINIGVSATDPAGGTLGQTFTSVTINTTGTPTTGLRAIISSGGTDYCATMTPGTPVALSTFNTMCWSPTATGAAAFTGTSSSITGVQLQVVGPDATAAAVAVSLCLVSIQFS